MVMPETNEPLFIEKRNQIQGKLEKLFTMSPPVNRVEVDKQCQELVFLLTTTDLLSVAYFGLQTLADDAMVAILARMDDEVPE